MCILHHLSMGVSVASAASLAARAVKYKTSHRPFSGAELWAPAAGIVGSLQPDLRFLASRGIQKHLSHWTHTLEAPTFFLCSFLMCLLSFLKLLQPGKITECTVGSWGLLTFFFALRFGNVFFFGRGLFVWGGFCWTVSSIFSKFSIFSSKSSTIFSLGSSTVRASASALSSMSICSACHENRCGQGPTPRRSRVCLATG